MDNRIETAIKNGNKLYTIFLSPTAQSVIEGRELRWMGRKQASLELLSNNPKDPADLISIFDLDADMFKGKFVQAINGSGHEWNEIRRLHSSSLAALLCFYNVSALNPLESSIDGRKVVFTESLFEIQNPVPGSEHPSNMDVVLIGTDKNSGRKVTLYLESKFSEYLTYGENDKISTKVYQSTYEKIRETLASINVGFTEYDKKYSKLIFTDKHHKHYLAGVKQMVSPASRYSSIFW